MSGETDGPFDNFKVLGTDTLFTRKPNSRVNYPYTEATGPYTVLGPVLLPQIYGKDLNTIEIGSSGTISLSIYDSNVMTINETSNVSHTGSPFNVVSFNSTRDDDALQMNSGSNIKKVLLDNLMVSESNVSGSNWNVLSTDLTGLRLIGPVAFEGDFSIEGDLSVSGVCTFESNVFIDGPILKIPIGDLERRPASSTSNAGYVFFNTELNIFEGVNNQGDWVGLGGVIDLDKDTFIVAEVNQNDDDTLRFHAGDTNIARMTIESHLMDVNVDVNFNNTFNVEGFTTMKSNVEIYEQLMVGNHTFMRNRLSVSGVTTLENDLSVGGNTNLVGQVTMDNTLDVVNVSTFNSNVDIIGKVTMANTLSVNGEVFVDNNAQIAENFSVLGKTTLTGETTINNDTIVNSNVIIRDNLNVGKTVTMETTVTRGTLSVGSSAIIEGTTKLNSDLIVVGPTVLQDTLEVYADVSLRNALSVSGDIMTDSTLLTNTITPNEGNDISINLGPNNTGTLTVNGNLDILGSFNNLNVTTTSLQVEDKVITLASGSNDVAGGQQYINVDGILNNKSGLKIEGIMDGFNSNSSRLFNNEHFGNVFEKSFLWNWTEGTQDTSSITGGMQNGPLSTINEIQSFYDDKLANKPSVQLKTESFWELKGGALRISSVIENQTGELEKISYSIRITNNKELQFVKHEYNSDGVLHSVNQVAAFGVSF
jgi:acyl-[acyl carrier protein]--UDP-N-acetylglucosamine O-acyltransferase